MDTVMTRAGSSLPLVPYFDAANGLTLAAAASDGAVVKFTMQIIDDAVSLVALEMIRHRDALQKFLSDPIGGAATTPPVNRTGKPANDLSHFVLRLLALETYLMPIAWTQHKDIEPVDMAVKQNVFAALDMHRLVVKAARILSAKRSESVEICYRLLYFSVKVSLVVRGAVERCAMMLWRHGAC